MCNRSLLLERGTRALLDRGCATRLRGTSGTDVGVGRYGPNEVDTVFLQLLEVIVDDAEPLEMRVNIASAPLTLICNVSQRVHGGEGAEVKDLD